MTLIPRSLFSLQDDTAPQRSPSQVIGRGLSAGEWSRDGETKPGREQGSRKKLESHRAATRNQRFLYGVLRELPRPHLFWGGSQNRVSFGKGRARKQKATGALAIGPKPRSSLSVTGCFSQLSCQVVSHKRKEVYPTLGGWAQFQKAPSPLNGSTEQDPPLAHHFNYSIPTFAIGICLRKMHMSSFWKQVTQLSTRGQGQ